MIVLPNPFDFNSTETTPAVGSGAEMPDQPRSAAPVVIEACHSQESFQGGACEKSVGLSGAPTQERPDTFDINGTEYIHEIWFGYAKQPKSEFPRGFDPHRFMDRLEAIVSEIEEAPLFLRRQA